MTRRIFASLSLRLACCSVALTSLWFSESGHACEGGGPAAHQCSSAKKSGHHQVQLIETESGVIEMKITGMACTSCVKKLEAALKSVKGVKSAVVSLEKKLARIEVSDPNVRQELEAAAAQAGFSAM